MTREKELKMRLLARAVEVKALKFGTFVLSSGKESRFYFDGRLLSLDPEGITLIATLFLKEFASSHSNFVGGPTLGADPIVSAITVLSYTSTHLVSGFLVRRHKKKYGTGNQIEGHLLKDARVIVVDDTCTTGKNLLASINVIEERGAKVVKVLVVLDRNEGGSAAIKKEGFDFGSLLTVKDNEVVLSD